MILTDDDSKDIWKCLGGIAMFSSQKYYNFRFSSVPSDRVLSWVWKSKCVRKLKVFAWLLINDKLNTKEIGGEVALQ